MEKKKKLIHRLRSKYRLVIMNEATFEEKASLTLTKLNVFITFSALTILFAGLLYLAVAYTPLREYLPGRVNSDEQRIIYELIFKMDSLESIINNNDAFLQNRKKILEDKIDTSATRNFSAEDSLTGSVNLNASEKELGLRKELQSETPPAVARNANFQATGIFAPFFTPLKGIISSHFDPVIEHFAADIVAKTDQTVKATLDGTVILASWTPETGHVIAVQHDDDIISIYKHNAVLLKKVGNFVDAGEAIAIVGNSGEISTGTHLHFELWHNGVAVNPEDYIVFK